MKNKESDFTNGYEIEEDGSLINCYEAGQYIEEFDYWERIEG